MKRVSYDGVVAVTADEVADAVLDFALVVARYNIYEQITFPVRVADHDEELTVMLGPTIHLSALTDSRTEEVVLPGAPAAAARLRARAQELAEPIRGIELDLSTWMSEQ